MIRSDLNIREIILIMVWRADPERMIKIVEDKLAGDCNSPAKMIGTKVGLWRWREMHGCGIT